MSDLITVAECEAYVATPGKFEGEARYVPYYWHVMNEYGADDEEWDDNDSVVYLFMVNEDDVAMFPELTVGTEVRIFEDEQGFVRLVRDN